jgi:hypothetical protein
MARGPDMTNTKKIALAEVVGGQPHDVSIE